MLIESIKYVTNNLKMVLFFSLLILLMLIPMGCVAIALLLLVENGANPFSVALLITSLIIIVLMLLFMQGYLVKFVRSRSSGDDRAPSFTPGSLSDLNVMLKEGFTAIIISIVYRIVPVVLFSLIFLYVFPISSFIELAAALDISSFIELDTALDPSSPSYTVDSEIAAQTLLGLMMPAILSLVGIVILLTVYGYYIVPAPFLAYANNRKFAAAFSLDKITYLLFDRVYFIGFLYVLLSVFLLTIISIVLGSIPIIGWIISIPVSIIGGLTVWSIWGMVYRDVCPPIES